MKFFFTILTLFGVFFIKLTPIKAYSFSLKDSIVHFIYFERKKALYLKVTYKYSLSYYNDIYIETNPDKYYLDSIFQTDIFRNNFLVSKSHFIIRGTENMRRYATKSNSKFKKGGQLKDHINNIYTITSSHLYCEHFIVQPDAETKKCVYTACFTGYTAKSKYKKNYTLIKFYPKHKAKKFVVHYDKRGYFTKMVFYDGLKRYVFLLHSIE